MLQVVRVHFASNCHSVTRPSVGCIPPSPGPPQSALVPAPSAHSPPQGPELIQPSPRLFAFSSTTRSPAGHGPRAALQNRKQPRHPIAPLVARQVPDHHVRAPRPRALGSIRPPLRQPVQHRIQRAAGVRVNTARHSSTNGSALPSSEVLPVSSRRV